MNICVIVSLQDFEESASRKWLSSLLWDADSQTEDCDSQHNFVDSFRYFHPDREKAYTCWRTASGARATNFGTRIDYILGDVQLVKQRFRDSEILPDVLGSDHCPVKATVDCTVIPAAVCPPLCTKFFPEFAGKQQKLPSYFTKSAAKPSAVLSVDVKPQEIKQTREVNGSTAKSPECVEPPKKRQKTEKDKQQKLHSFFKAKTEPEPASVATVVGAESSDAQQVKEADATKTSELNMVEAKPQSLSRSSSAQSWKSIFKGPPAAPKCKGHDEPCVLRTVKKDSLNKGRQFYVCCRPDGEKGNPLARCDHFEWVDKKAKPKK